MTPGQDGGQYGDPPEQPGGEQGQPQNWNAPPPPPSQGQPPYGPPPYGQPPQGQPPYGRQWPGYTPAPPAPTGYGAPTPLERPVTVRAGLGAFVASLILGLVGSLVTFSDIDALVARARRSAGANSAAITDDVIRTALVVGAIIGLVWIAVYILFLWFAWKGRNWARIVLWVLGGLSVVTGLVGLGAGNTGQSGFLESLSVFQWLLTLAGVVLLALKPTNDWYRYRAWLRATGQPG